MRHRVNINLEITHTHKERAGGRRYVSNIKLLSNIKTKYSFLSFLWSHLVT